MNEAQLAQIAASAATQANMQLFQALQNAPKSLVMLEPRGPSQLVEVIVNQAGLSRIPFPDVPNLRSQTDQTVVIKAIRLITPSVLPVGSLTGNQNAPLTELQKMCLTIYCEGWEKGQLIPLLTLNDMFTEGSGEPYKMTQTRFDNWKAFDWNKTFVQLSNGTVTVLPGGNPYSICLDVEYVKLNKNNIPIVGPN